MDLNRVTIIGRLTRDAELKSTGSGISVSKFSIAVNRRTKNGDEWKDEASFFDVTLFGKQAESLDQYLLKGKQVAIDGELRQERWTDNQTGQQRSKVVIVADNVQLLGSKENGNGNSYSQQTPRRASF